jgi:peptidoglycan/xylan/chitin deacetylase (PgdA/CDA1 family)
MRLLTKVKRRLVAPTLYHARYSILGIPRNFRNVIINYHGVIGGSFTRINNRHLDLAQFEQDLCFYKKFFNVVTLSEIFEKPEEIGAKGNPKLAITFDDGFENNLSFAIPLLEKYSFPATIFVLAGTIDQPDYLNWSDVLDCIYSLSKKEFIDFMGNRFVRQRNGGFMDSSGLMTLDDFIKSQGTERLQPLQELTKMLYDEPKIFENYGSQLRLLNKEQILKCSKSGFIEIGSHSKNHFNLGHMHPSLIESELKESKLVIENLIQQEVKSIAYPDGDYSKLTIQIAERHGYSRQLAVRYLFDDDANDSRIKNRFSYSNSTTHQSNMVRLGLKWKEFSF